MANIGKYAIGIRLLLLKQYIEAHAGVNRYVTRGEMEQYLADKGYPVEKKTLYSDLAVLDSEFNMKLEYNPRKKGYRLLNPLFDIYELRLLVDCVQMSSLITDEEVATMVSKIKQLSVESDRVSLERPTVVADRITRNKDSFIKKMDTIHQAIAAKKQLSFCYHYYVPDRDNTVKTSKKVFVVNPRQLLWKGGVLYLQTYDNGVARYPGLEVYDMTNIKVLSTPCDTTPDPNIVEAVELFRELDERDAASQKVVTVRFHNSAIQKIFQIFGDDVLPVPYDDEHFIANIKTSLDETFFARIAFFGCRAKIFGPDEALIGFTEYHSEVADLYNDDIEPDYLQNTHILQDDFHKFMKGEV